MMDGVSQELMNLLLQLLPGFLAAWLLYGLTSYPKPSQFERVIQALVFSFLIRALLPIEESIMIQFGKIHSFGLWGKNSELLASAISGLLFGLVASYYANNDKLYACARKFKLTRRTAYPSEWFGAFTDHITYVVLHLAGNRRIIGWARQWPSEPTSGHFMLMDAAWLKTDGEEIALTANELILIPAKDVEMVEFVKLDKELKNGTETTKSTSPNTAK